MDAMSTQPDSEYKNPSRRIFLQQSTQTALVIGVSALTGSSLLSACRTSKNNAAGFVFKTPLNQQVLPYAYGALEPFIDARTMEIHYTKHAAGYASNLDAAVKAEKAPTDQGVEGILQRVSQYSDKMRNNAGGHYNHELFWQCMKANGEGRPSGALATAIENQFKSFADFKSQFADAAKTRFGSGWAWLLVDGNKKLQISSTANQDNPCMDIATVKGTPILGLDVWEHAYYLKYQNKRADYIDAWWNLVNWSYVQDRYAKLVG
jgi:Fe-Mn family superoxide dismutase